MQGVTSDARRVAAMVSVIHVTGSLRRLSCLPRELGLMTAGTLLGSQHEK